MVSNFQYAYLAGDLLALPLWIILFVHRKDLRKEMLIASVAIGIVAVLTEPFFLQDYWHPQTFNGWPVGIEDFLYGFLLGGIASVIYEEIYGKKYSKRHDRKHHWGILLIPFMILSISTFAVGKVIVNLSTMYAALISLFVAMIFIIYYRHDLFIDSIISGLLVGIFTMLGFLVFLKIFPGVVENLWLVHNLNGIFVFGIPSEELLWAFGLGAVAGPFYEFFMGLRFKKS